MAEHTVGDQYHGVHSVSRKARFGDTDFFCPEFLMFLYLNEYVVQSLWFSRVQPSAMRIREASYNHVP
jgi:hypothetical protein